MDAEKRYCPFIKGKCLGGDCAVSTDGECAIPIINESLYEIYKRLDDMNEKLDALLPPLYAQPEGGEPNA